jgi:hypothetical protein
MRRLIDRLLGHRPLTGRRAVFEEHEVIGYWVPDREPDWSDVYREVGPALSRTPAIAGSRVRAGNRWWSFEPGE